MVELRLASRLPELVCQLLHDARQDRQCPVAVVGHLRVLAACQFLPIAGLGLCLERHDHLPAAALQCRVPPPTGGKEMLHRAKQIAPKASFRWGGLLQQWAFQQMYKKILR